MTWIVTLDGASGTGKTSLAYGLAKRLRADVLPSGILYRMVAYWDILGHAIDDMPYATLSTDLTITSTGAIIWRGEKLTHILRQEDLGQRSSILAKNPKVRGYLLSIQRAWPCVHGLVAEGRDMGSMVFPHAELKLFITCSVQVRAKRRLEQLLSLGIHGRLEDVQAEIIARDQRDQARDHAPLIQPEGSIAWDNGVRDIESQLDALVVICAQHIRGLSVMDG